MIEEFKEKVRTDYSIQRTIALGYFYIILLLASIIGLYLFYFVSVLVSDCNCTDICYDMCTLKVENNTFCEQVITHKISENLYNNNSNNFFDEIYGDINGSD